ncbi:restriction endonuclease subunit S [Maritalea sp.]|uniref:restriction endonuclease subunit S n=1 Tax=Maritalea sp. TaxID=2003361 RepID=UPI003EF2555E
MNWATAKLDELGSVGRGRSRHRPRNDPSLYGGDYPFVQTADIASANYYIESYNQTYNDKGLEQSKIWTEETLCMTIAGENTAKTAVLNFPACFPDSIVGFIPDNEKADLRFVKHALDLMKSHFRSVSKGATQDNLSLAKILSFDIPTPPVEYQKRIAGCLAAYDDLIQNNRRRIALLEEAARLLYREWFVHFRFPGHEHVMIVNGVPEEWDEVALGDRVEIKKGRNITKRDVNFGRVPVVAGGLKPAYFHDTPNVKGPVITISASGANAGHVGIYFTDIWASDCSFIAGSTNPRIHFIHQLLLQNAPQIHAMQKGAAQPHVYPKDLQRLPTIWPSESILNDFTDYIQPIYEQIERLEAQSLRLAEARDLLLPRLMDGRLEI